LDAIAWELKDIYPRYADLLSTLDQLFADHPFLRRAYKCGWRYYKGQLQRFSRRDRDHGTRWQAHTARRLFALGREQIELAVALRKAGYDKAWLIQNCRPSGGKWTSKTYYADNPTGNHCGQPICVWCWMRRFDDIMQLLSSEEEVKPRSKLRGVRKGLGLGEKVCVTRYMCTTEDAAVSRPHRADFVQRLNKAIRHVPRENGAVVTPGSRLREFSKGIRVTTPVRSGEELRLQASYFHQGPCYTPPRLQMRGLDRISGPIVLERHESLPVAEALRRFYPFPAWIYDEHVDGVRKFIKATRYLQMYGMLDLSDSPQSVCA